VSVYARLPQILGGIFDFSTKAVDVAVSKYFDYRSLCRRPKLNPVKGSPEAHVCQLLNCCLGIGSLRKRDCIECKLHVVKQLRQIDLPEPLVWLVYLVMVNLAVVDSVMEPETPVKVIV
jgi:hypothetical protein